MLNTTSPDSPKTAGRKRPHCLTAETSAEQDSAQPHQEQHTLTDEIPSITPSISSAFRNVSACHRCRLRKNRCDQRLPRCQLCEKAGVRCIGYDPITKREIPRSYVFFLEARIEYLERALREHNVDFKDAVAFGDEMAVCGEQGGELGQAHGVGIQSGDISTGEEREAQKDDWKDKERKYDVDGKRDDDKDNWRIHNLVSNIGMVSVQGTSDPRYLGSTSGISFARVVFAAVKSSVPGNISERGPIRSSERLPHSATGTGTSTMRDSLFGLQTRPLMNCAVFPNRDLADRLVTLYFEHANPQMPILHRTDFMEILDCTYATDEKSRSARSLYTLNIVFAIGAGIIFEDKSFSSDDKKHETNTGSPSSTSKRPKLSGCQHQPEEYHASAIIHLESLLNSSASSGGFGGLEELQAVLLLASFALLRPVAPGLWYIVGVAMRLAVDLGLHYEDGAGIDYAGDENRSKLRIDARERGRREWVRDLRRRLWWCVYSFDRLVGCSVGRPFGISDQAISTEFPSLLDDKYITKSGFATPPDGAPSYKHPAQHYFKLRVLQSEIQDVLQCQQARLARQRVPQSANVFTRSDLSSPFLQGFNSLRSWRKDVHRRLGEWQESTPDQQDTGVRFPIAFLELNYWQTVIMMYQQCLTAPAELAGELTPAEDIGSSPFSNIDDVEEEDDDDDDDDDDVYFKVAEAGQKVIRIYRQLHRVRLANYTYLATHHIFMAGISFLYAIWHSPLVRSRLVEGKYHWQSCVLISLQTLDEVDFTVLAATSVLGDLTHKCPPAEACRDAFERMSKATIQMSLSTTGFGSQVDLTRHTRANAHHPPDGLYYHGQRSRYPLRYPYPGISTGSASSRRQTQTRNRQSRPMPQFDMNLDDLFGDNSNNTAAAAASAERASDNARNPAQTRNLSRTRGWSELSMPHMAPDQRTPSASTMMYSGGGNEDQPISSQQQQQYAYNTNSPPQSAYPELIFSTNHSHSHSHHSSFHAPDFEGHQPEMGLDFLDFGPTTESDGLLWNLDLEGNNDPDVAMPSISYGAGHSMGIDLGFGMAVDFQHDWNENGNYDMLEGYFFGGATGNGGESAE